MSIKHEQIDREKERDDGGQIDNKHKKKLQKRDKQADRQLEKSGMTRKRNIFQYSTLYAEVEMNGRTDLRTDRYKE